MAARQIYDPEGFRNIETDGRITGYQFRFKAQYYRGITLSIIRDIQINIDGESAKRKISVSVNGETFTMEEMRTVIDSDYRWEFGEFATVSVLKKVGWKKGNIIFMRNRLLHHHTCRSRLKQIAKQILLLSNRRDER